MSYLELAKMMGPHRMARINRAAAARKIPPRKLIAEMLENIWRTTGSAARRKTG